MIGWRWGLPGMGCRKKLLLVVPPGSMPAEAEVEVGTEPVACKLSQVWPG